MRDQVLTTAGERIAINCELPWVDALIDEAVSGERRNLNGDERAIAVNIKSASRSFPTVGL